MDYFFGDVNYYSHKNYANPLISVGIRFFAGAHQLFNPLMLQIISNKEYSLFLYYTLPKSIGANYALGAHA